MHRIEGENNINGMFTDGPPGTIVASDWLNAVQEEICYVITQSGDLPFQTVSDTKHQLYTSIGKQINTSLTTNVYPLTNELFGRDENAIINGGMSIWQRGTSFVAIATAAFSADRWIYLKNGTMVHTISQEAGSLPSNCRSIFALKAEVTTADVAMGAIDHCGICQKIEGQLFYKFAGSYGTLSFWVRSSKTGTYCVSFRNSNYDRSYIVEYTINAANTWEEKIIPVNFNFVGGSWDFTTGVGLRIYFALSAGSDYLTTPDEWKNGNYLATANQVNHCDTNGATFYFTQVNFVLGNLATTRFFNRAYQIELLLCRRYYENGRYTFNGLAVTCNVGDAILVNPYFKTLKRTTGGTLTIIDIGGNSGKITLLSQFLVATNNVAIGATSVGNDGFFLWASSLAVTDRGIDFYWYYPCEL